MSVFPPGDTRYSAMAFRSSTVLTGRCSRSGRSVGGGDTGSSNGVYYMYSLVPRPSLSFFRSRASAKKAVREGLGTRLLHIYRQYSATDRAVCIEHTRSAQRLG